MESNGEVLSQGRGAGAKLCETPTGNWVEDEDSDLLQEQTQAICEELQRRGASTTLALARHLGFEKSSAINPLMFLLLEKNVLVRVSDIPPIWSLSPTFPMSPHFGTNQGPLSPQSPKPPSPLTLGLPAAFSGAAGPLQCTPINRDPVPAPISVITALTPVATTIPASVIPASTPATTISAPVAGTVPASEIPAPTPATSPISASVATTVPASVIPAPTPATAPISAPGAATPDRSQVHTPEFVVSRTALTFLEHVIPVPEDKVVHGKTSPKTPLPESVSKLAITFKEHLIPENTDEKKVPVSTNHSSATTSRVPLPSPTIKNHVIPTPPPRPVFEERRHDKHRYYRQNQPRGRKQEPVQIYRRSQRQVENEDTGPNQSHKKRKTEECLTELQLRILYELKEIGPTKTLELSKKLGLVTCRDVNPSLYDLQNKSLVVKINDRPVVWQLYEPGLYRRETEVEGEFSDGEETRTNW